MTEDQTAEFDYSDFVTRDNDSQLRDLVFPEARYLSAEKNLMRAALWDVIQKVEKKRKISRWDMAWLIREDDDYVFSFAHLCEVFGLNPSAVRKALLAKLAEPKQIKRRLRLVVKKTKDDGYSHPYVNGNHCPECKSRYNKIYKKQVRENAPLEDEPLMAVGDA